ncbi:molecular chaperone DnaJ [Pseudoloma neurophilia]|uniref:Molecular chaperone DnaJ n=1 Tax=Pseudoloma neurophilia TaxID=146866 RepID=A0A0R0LX45_9MICR|nr:molecular chaperone DnaJ [Pseudoloma neurophilia]
MLIPFRLLTFKPKMTVREAHQILNLPYISNKNSLFQRQQSVEKNGKNALMSRYSTLMALNHPDTGGSAKLAQKINEARDLLMKEL